MKTYSKILFTAAVVSIAYFGKMYSDESPSVQKNNTFANAENLAHEANSRENVDKPAETYVAGNNGRLLELPGKLKGIPERIISHTGYTLSFNREHNQPNWVAWELTRQETEGNTQRSDDFEPDPLVPLPHRVTTDDYKHSGYDRGHMVPAADMKWSGKAMNDCFYMSNMCPQNGSLNSGAWSTLEKACRRWAQQEGKVYIVCGPVFKGNKQKKIGKEHLITVPDGFYKVVLSVQKNKEKAIGFYYGNHDGKQPMTQTAKSVDEIEALTGIDFFVNLPDPLEKKIETSYNLKLWK